LEGNRRSHILVTMKYQEGQPVILLTMEGKPAAGTAVVKTVDSENESYTVLHYLRDGALPDRIDNVPEGRLVTHNFSTEFAGN
jgi:hypothetical protein